MILAAWIMELPTYEQLDIGTDTAHLAVFLLDEYIIRACPQDIKKNRFQLVGAICVQMACDMMQPNSPTLFDLETLMNTNVRKRTFEKWQAKILCTLDFRAWRMSPYEWMLVLMEKKGREPTPYACCLLEIFMVARGCRFLNPKQVAEGVIGTDQSLLPALKKACCKYDQLKNFEALKAHYTILRKLFGCEILNSVWDFALS